MHPCLLTDVRFDVDLPDEDEVQVRSGCGECELQGLGVVPPLSNSYFGCGRGRKVCGTTQQDSSLLSI